VTGGGAATVGCCWGRGRRRFGFAAGFAFPAGVAAGVSRAPAETGSFVSPTLGFASWPAA
jgi:hypothetical protein